MKFCLLKVCKSTSARSDILYAYDVYLLIFSFCQIVNIQLITLVFFHVVKRFIIKNFNLEMQLKVRYAPVYF